MTSNEAKTQWTPGPWTWTVEDKSMATLHGAKHEDSVLIMTTCGQCEARRSEWKWGDCYAPDLANARLIAAAPELVEALEDMLSGWRYIRQTHGDLYGVGWDRAQQKARALLHRITQSSSVSEEVKV